MVEKAEQWIHDLSRGKITQGFQCCAQVVGPQQGEGFFFQLPMRQDTIPDILNGWMQVKSITAISRSYNTNESESSARLKR